MRPLGGHRNCLSGAGGGRREGWGTKGDGSWIDGVTVVSLPTVASRSRWRAPLLLFECRQTHVKRPRRFSESRVLSWVAIGRTPVGTCSCCALFVVLGAGLSHVFARPTGDKP